MIIKLIGGPFDGQTVTYPSLDTVRKRDAMEKVVCCAIPHDSQNACYYPDDPKNWRTSGEFKFRGIE